MAGQPSDASRDPCLSVRGRADKTKERHFPSLRKPMLAARSASPFVPFRYHIPVVSKLGKDTLGASLCHGEDRGDEPPVFDRRWKRSYGPRPAPLAAVFRVIRCLLSFRVVPFCSLRN
ncbi:hypothetical protein SKAU_G00402820 [Synaphobranchus kaupii]|uniref:Uncharacterized protein n=1 Tax=Synaphobranchus kaupii TaxID=118154 RepID=A0A9Q1E9F9_SYNKA|nr:hypothetical protein SKAU_G00402820 [Synaphobranchus kaupii]